jgi:hypothetical protein
VTDDHEKRMTAEEGRKAEEIKSLAADWNLIHHKHFQSECAAVYPELDAALGNYMAALDNPSARAGALSGWMSDLSDFARSFKTTSMIGRSTHAIPMCFVAHFGETRVHRLGCEGLANGSLGPPKSAAQSRWAQSLT